MFGVDFTWLGWIWIILAFIGTAMHFIRGLFGIEDYTSPEVSGIAGVLSVAMLIGFFTVGFVE